MLLMDQVDLFRRNLNELQLKEVALPLLGGFRDTCQTYYFNPSYFLHGHHNNDIPIESGWK